MSSPSQMRRRCAWLVLAVQLLAGPVASLSHRHDTADGCCGGGTVAPAAPSTAVSPRPRSGFHRHRDGDAGHRCRFSACRTAGRLAERPQGAAQRPSRDEPPTVRRTATGANDAPCAACRFLAQFVAVVAPPPCDNGVFFSRPEPTAARVQLVAAIAAAFLARGPPA